MQLYNNFCFSIYSIYNIILTNFCLSKGYNSEVECYLDVIEVISSNLIIPNVFMYKISKPGNIFRQDITILFKKFGSSPNLNIISLYKLSLKKKVNKFYVTY